MKINPVALLALVGSCTAGSNDNNVHYQIRTRRAQDGGGGEFGDLHNEDHHSKKGGSYDETEIDVFYESGCRPECFTEGMKMGEGQALCVNNLQLGLKDGRLTLAGPNDLEEYDKNDDDVVLWQSDNVYPGDLVVIHRGRLMVIDTIANHGVVWTNSYASQCTTNKAVMSLLNDKGFTLFDDYEYPIWRLFDDEADNSKDKHESKKKSGENRIDEEFWMAEALDCEHKDGGVEDSKSHKKHVVDDGTLTGDGEVAPADPNDEVVDPTKLMPYQKQRWRQRQRQKQREKEERQKDKGNNV